MTIEYIDLCCQRGKRIHASLFTKAILVDGCGQRKGLHSFEFRLFRCAMSGLGLVLPFLFWLHDNLGDAFG